MTCFVHRPRVFLCGVAASGFISLVKPKHKFEWHQIAVSFQILEERSNDENYARYAKK